MAGASGSVIGEAVIEDKYFENETQRIYRQITERFLRQIQAWMIMANKYYTDSSKWGTIKSSSSYFLKDSQNKGQSFSDLFKKGFQSHVAGFNREKINVTAFRQRMNQLNEPLLYDQKSGKFSLRMVDESSSIRATELIKSGYRILTEVGEMIRQDTVRYAVHIKGGNIGLNESLNFVLDLDLDQFLKYTVGSRGKIGVGLYKSQKEILKNYIESQSIKPANLDLENYFNNVKGHILLKGKNKEFDQSARGQKLQSYYNTLQEKGKKDPFNRGHVFEAMLSLVDAVQAYNVSGKPFKGDKGFWTGVAKTAITMEEILTALIAALNAPSSFIKGAEASEGFLKGYQAKASGAALTSLNTLMTEMNHLYSIIVPWVAQIDGKVSALKAEQNYPSNEEIVQALQNMTDREYTKKITITIPF